MHHRLCWPKQGGCWWHFIPSSALTGIHTFLWEGALSSTTNGRIHLLSTIQFKKHTRPHLTPPKCSPEHHPSISSTFSVIDTIRVKFFILLSPYPDPGAALHSNFNTNLISPNKCFPIIHSEMGMSLGKVETTLPVKSLEKKSTLGYPMIVAKVFEGPFELSDATVQLEVLDNCWNR